MEYAAIFAFLITDDGEGVLTEAGSGRGSSSLSSPFAQNRPASPFVFFYLPMDRHFGVGLFLV
jgi:hypothetical protein